MCSKQKYCTALTWLRARPRLQPNTSISVQVERGTTGCSLRPAVRTLLPRHSASPQRINITPNCSSVPSCSPAFFYFFLQGFFVLFGKLILFNAMVIVITVEWSFNFKTYILGMKWLSLKEVSTCI